MSGILPAAIGGFALGSIPFSWIVARLMGGFDIRRVGSGNVGATNVARSLGWRPGVAALLLDALKGSAAVLLAPLVPGAGTEGAVLWAGGMAVAGHMFSPFMGFRGGKGVATGAGVFAILAPVPLAAAAGVFAVTLAVSRMVSLGSILASAALPLAILLIGPGPSAAFLAALVGALIIARHRDNIRRIRNGTESRFGAGRGAAGGDGE